MSNSAALVRNSSTGAPFEVCFTHTPFISFKNIKFYTFVKAHECFQSIHQAFRYFFYAYFKRKKYFKEANLIYGGVAV